jgi:threonine/homoserine/homoserine lactone efflux protein
VTAGDYAVLAGILVGVMSLVVLGYGLTAEAARRIFKDSASKLWLDRSSAIMFAAAGLWIIVR